MSTSVESFMQRNQKFELRKIYSDFYVLYIQPDPEIGVKISIFLYDSSESSKEVAAWKSLVEALSMAYPDLEEKNPPFNLQQDDEIPF